MNNKLPIAITTEGCYAMAATVREVLPDTKHRLCLWHLEQNIFRNLKNVPKVFGKEFKDFANMDTTQRCESMNSHRHRFMGKQLKIHKLVEWFDKEFERLREGKLRAEFKTKYGVTITRGPLAHWMHTSHSSTREPFTLRWDDVLNAKNAAKNTETNNVI